MSDSTSGENRLVPKVHPATRPVEPEDPMTLHATPVFGDPAVMLRCVVQEYAWMGWDAGRIFSLFFDPFYPALNGLLRLYGEAGIRERIAAVLDRSGVLRFEAVVCDGPEPAEHDSEPDLVELRIPVELCRERPPWRSESGLEPGGMDPRPLPTEE